MGTMIAVRQLGLELDVPERVEVLDRETPDLLALRVRYDRLTALVLRMGDWLSGPRGQLLERAEWEAQFGRYREHLEELRRLGDQLRPVTLRERHEPLAGDALVNEVLELFAA